MRAVLICLLLLVAAASAQAANPGELLEPEQAFRMSARALDARTVVELATSG